MVTPGNETSQVIKARIVPLYDSGAFRIPLIAELQDLVRHGFSARNRLMALSTGACIFKPGMGC